MPNGPGAVLRRPALDRWRDGNTGTPGVWHFDSGRRGRHLLITSLIHGNEPCGAWAVLGLLEAGIRPQIGRLTLAFCNLAAFDLHDAARPLAARCVDEDLNRQWSAECLAAGRSLEARRAAELRPFVDAADWLLDLHSMHAAGDPLCLAGPRPRNRRLARRLGGVANVVVDAGHADGTRLRDYGRFGLSDAEAPQCRALLIECGGHGEVRSLFVARDQCARMLAASGVLDAGTVAARLPGWRGPDVPACWGLVVTGVVTARRTPLRLDGRWGALSLVPRAGTVIGAQGADPLVTPHDDCVLVMPAARRARPGVTVLRFARRTRLE